MDQASQVATPREGGPAESKVDIRWIKNGSPDMLRKLRSVRQAEGIVSDADPE